ncbi:unnamed protein product [Amoebophrya sp. A120]|nr:unnamed protein product [Amoebophrya sp. A120]|eukprot:GSA120T00009228001.1
MTGEKTTLMENYASFFGLPWLRAFVSSNRKKRPVSERRSYFRMITGKIQAACRPVMQLYELKTNSCRPFQAKITAIKKSRSTGVA